MGLPVITRTKPTRLNAFYVKLATNVQTLESMGKEKDNRGYVRLTLDKLPGIRADLVKLGVTVRGTLTTLEDMTRETTYCFKLNKRVEGTGFVFTVSLKNINQLTATRIKG